MIRQLYSRPSRVTVQDIRVWASPLSLNDDGPDGRSVSDGRVGCGRLLRCRDRRRCERCDRKSDRAGKSHPRCPVYGWAFAQRVRSQMT